MFESTVRMLLIKPPLSAAFLLDPTNELLMRNRGDLPRPQLPFPPLDLVIGNVRSRGRQCVEEFGGQRGALTLGQRQRLLFDFCEVHTAKIQTPAAVCNRSQVNAPASPARPLPGNSYFWRTAARSVSSIGLKTSSLTTSATRSRQWTTKGDPFPQHNMLRLFRLPGVQEPRSCA